MMKVNQKKIKKTSTQLRKKRRKTFEKTQRERRGREGVKEYMLDPCYILVSLLQNVSRDVT